MGNVKKHVETRWIIVCLLIAIELVQLIQLETLFDKSEESI